MRNDKLYFVLITVNIKNILQTDEELTKCSCYPRPYGLRLFQHNLRNVLLIQGTGSLWEPFTVVIMEHFKELAR